MPVNLKSLEKTNPNLYRELRSFMVQMLEKGYETASLTKPAINDDVLQSYYDGIEQFKNFTDALVDTYESNIGAQDVASQQKVLKQLNVFVELIGNKKTTLHDDVYRSENLEHKEIQRKAGIAENNIQDLSRVTIVEGKSVPQTARTTADKTKEAARFKAEEFALTLFGSEAIIEFSNPDKVNPDSKFSGSNFDIFELSVKPFGDPSDESAYFHVAVPVDEDGEVKKGQLPQYVDDGDAEEVHKTSATITTENAAGTKIKVPVTFKNGQYYARVGAPDANNNLTNVIVFQENFDKKPSKRREIKNLLYKGKPVWTDDVHYYPDATSDITLDERYLSSAEKAIKVTGRKGWNSITGAYDVDLWEKDGKYFDSEDATISVDKSSTKAMGPEGSESGIVPLEGFTTAAGGQLWVDKDNNYFSDAAGTKRYASEAAIPTTPDLKLIERVDPITGRTHILQINQRTGEIVGSTDTGLLDADYQLQKATSDLNEKQFQQNVLEFGALTAQRDFENQLAEDEFKLNKTLGFQAQALDEAQFNAEQLQFNASMAENARQFDEANRLRALAQQEEARATNIQAGFQITEARAKALDQVRDILSNPADYLARGFALAGQDAPFTPVTQADLINQVSNEYNAYTDFLSSMGAGFNADDYLSGRQQTGNPLNVVNPDDFYDEGDGDGGGGNNQQANKNAFLMKRAGQISRGEEPTGGIQAADIEFFSKSGFVAPGMPGESQNVNTGFVADFLGNNPQYMTNKDLYTTGGAESFIPGGVFDSSDIRTSGTAGEITEDNPLGQSELDALANLSEANIQTGFGGGLTAEQIAAFRKTGQVPAAEHGGMFGNPVVVGDSSSGKENQELVMSADGAPMVVLPLTNQQIDILQGKRNNKMPKAQTGGMFGSQDFVGFGQRMGNIGFGGTMYNQLPSGNITQQDIIERAERFGTPRVSRVAQGFMPQPMQFGFPLMTPGQLNALTGDERDELRTRLATRNVSLSDVEQAVMQRFGPTGTRRGRRRF